MKIDSLTNLRSTKAQRKKQGQSAGGSRFADALTQEPSGQSGVGAQAPLGAVESLLALQEVPDALSQKRAARQRGQSLLDELEELRLGLLSGVLPRSTLERLSNLISSRQAEMEDPRLAEILAEIELRAAVELAKYERRGGKTTP